MKIKLLSLLIIVAMLLTACGGNEPERTPEPPPSPSPVIITTPEPEASQDETSDSVENVDNGNDEKSDRPMGSGGRGGNSGGMSMNVENDAEALEILAQCAPKFEQFIFTDPDTGFELEYSLFIPEAWDGSTAYPLVQFMPDSTGTGKSALELVENYLGAAIWASDRDQEKHPCFVLVPAYTNTLADDNWSVSPQLETGIKLLLGIIE